MALLVPSGEQKHIPPGEKENHRLKNALGRDVLVNREGIPSNKWL